MKFYCLLPVRDEEDIIAQCLDHLLTWADGIFIFDTGSNDKTWEIILNYAAKYKKVHPLVKDDIYYSESRLRGYLFNKARSVMKDDDWFLRVDADEFHLISPPDFVNTRLKKHETIAYHQYYNFELTLEEAEWLNSVNSILEERKRPISERRRFYSISHYSEPRLCKYRSSMKWPGNVSFPYNAGFVAKERLPILHYPNRDPVQMKSRCRIRNIMLADKENKLNWSNLDIHWTIEDWRAFIVNKADPNLHYLYPGSRIEEVKLYNHLAPFYKRALQRILHTCFLKFLDGKRNSYVETEYPRKLNKEVIASLKEEHGFLF